MQDIQANYFENYVPYRCVGGGLHSWRASGQGYSLWVSNNTSGVAPSDAQFYREERCCSCDAVRHVLTSNRRDNEQPSGYNQFDRISSTLHTAF